MCELPARSWRDALTPGRVLTGLAALLMMGVGLVGGFGAGLAIIGVGAALLVAAVVLPSIQQMEFGIPTGVRVVTAVRDREGAFRNSFESQRPDFELVANLLCSDPATAARLLEAAWAKAAATWRGPVTADLRPYVLCCFAHLLTAHDHWTRTQDNAEVQPATPLAGLELATRIVVVFREFAEIPAERLSSMVGRSVEQIEMDLLAAEAALARALTDKGKP